MLLLRGIFHIYFTPLFRLLILMQISNYKLFNQSAMLLNKFNHYSCLLLLLMISLSCKKSGSDNSGEEEGIIKGQVLDTQGQPLAGVKIIIDNSIVYNKYITTSTDANGNYRARLSTGSWIAYAQLIKTYNGKQYSLYLDPENEDGFGIKGGTRNFRWKLTGNKKGSLTGTYGGSVLLSRGVGSVLYDSENIEYTLTPVGNLIDGSAGNVLHVKEDAGYPRLADIPIGRYQVTAVYKSTTGDLPLKLMNFYNQAAGYSNSLQIDFDPNSPDGDNIASIVYHE